MPVEIREIVIKATVNEAAGNGGGNATAGSAGGGNAVQDCIEQVFQLIDDKKER